LSDIAFAIGAGIPDASNIFNFQIKKEAYLEIKKKYFNFNINNY
jgi:hypothetical protein